MDRRRPGRKFASLLACAIVVAGCNDTDADSTVAGADTTSANGAETRPSEPTSVTPAPPGSVPAETVTASTAPSETPPVSDGTAPADPDPVPTPQALVETNQFDLLAAGTYVSDMLSLELEITTTAEFNVWAARPGSIQFESPTSTNEAYTGVGLFVVDTLVDSDVLGRQLARRAATVDLDDFLRSRDGVDVVDVRDDELGGLPAKVWRIEYTGPCEGCWAETLFNITGWSNLWWTLPGQVQELWAVEAPGSPIIVAVEAPAAGFDAWRDDVRTHLFDGLRFGPATGYSLARPVGDAFGAGFGEYAIGRAELEVVDGSRPTLEVQNDIGMVVPASDERRLLLSVAYPSEEGGFGAAPADGSFPLVVVAPALRDAAIALPADRQLASHGFVVVTVRFPESSFPGNATAGVPSQPADVSFVIDQIERGVLAPDLTSVTDTERIGLIGHSGGATTAFGVLAYECCQDARVDAVLAHAGTPYDFRSTRVPTVAPVLHVVSKGDVVAPADAVREFHDGTDGPSAIAVLEYDSHLGWLDPDASSYDEAFVLALGFLDRHLNEMPVDLATLATGQVFVEFDER